MTLSDLYARIAQEMHRTDLTSQMGNFTSDANERINRRFGTALVLPALTTDPLPAPDLLYFYAAMQSAGAYVNNGELAQYYSDQWELECDRQNVLQPGTSVDNYALVPPVMIGV